MTKKVEKKFSFSDFIQPMLSEEAVPMDLVMSSGNGEQTDTGQHLLVLHSKCKKVARAYYKYGQAINDSLTATADIDDAFDRATMRNEMQDAANSEFFKAIVVGWSFKQKFNKKNINELMHDNEDLIVSTINYSNEQAHYIKKK